jgi:hypothetical protein
MPAVPALVGKALQFDRYKNLLNLLLPGGFLFSGNSFFEIPADESPNRKL